MELNSVLALKLQNTEITILCVLQLTRSKIASCKIYLIQYGHRLFTILTIYYTLITCTIPLNLWLQEAAPNQSFGESLHHFWIEVSVGASV